MRQGSCALVRVAFVGYMVREGAKPSTTSKGAVGGWPFVIATRQSSLVAADNKVNAQDNQGKPQTQPRAVH